MPLYAGWDSKRKRYNHTRRVYLVTDDGYVVVLRIVNATKAVFNTAYLINNPEGGGKLVLLQKLRDRCKSSLNLGHADNITLKKGA